MNKEAKEQNPTRLVLGGVGFVDLIVEPHVGHGHPVLGQGARLVGADGGGGAQSFHGLQVLHQAVLTSHALGGQRQTHLEETRDNRDKPTKRKIENKEREELEFYCK